MWEILVWCPYVLLVSLPEMGGGGGGHAFIKTCENDRLQVALGRGGERAMQYLSQWYEINSEDAFGRTTEILWPD